MEKEESPKRSSSEEDGGIELNEKQRARGTETEREGVRGGGRGERQQRMGTAVTEGRTQPPATAHK